MMMKKRIQKKASRLALAGLIAWGALFSLFISVPAARAQGRFGRSRLVARAEAVSGDTFRFATQTPRGVRVISITKPPTEVLNAIDNGFTELFAVARRHGYRARLNHSDYTVFIARPDRTKDSQGAYSPDIALPAAQYAGSVYDQGGFIYAAGLVLDFQSSAIVIAEHERDWQRVANVARYEGEHLVLYYNDRNLFARTMDHSRGGGHPILQ